MTFLGYLVAAVRQKYEDFGAATEALLRHVASMGPTRDVVVATFLADLAEVGDGEVILILDDFHLVDGSDDVAYILGRLFEQAPDGFHFVLSGRGRPEIPLGRIAAQGRLAELSTRDLRFTRTEVEEFFVSNGQTLRRELCDVVEERTEGWVASLQLVAASITTSHPGEVDAFIKALSGARGSLYDFLAEEVLTRLAALTQRVLVHAALLDRVKPQLVAAALSTTPEPVDAENVEACIRDVATLGLLTQGQGETDGSRIHPLLRQFLGRRLEESASDAEIQAMHLAVAHAAEDVDWLVAGKHYAAGGRPEEAMRVLGSAASQALGSGAWGAAAEIIDSMPDVDPPPAVQVIRARAFTSNGDPDAALETLSLIDRTILTAGERSLIRLAEALALHAAGEAALVRQV
jgi:LuxR family maltose regulon positive regulatory protein